MARITAVINQKGGVGKTTTSMNLAAGLNYRGMRVLLLDMDAQGNSSMTMGAQKSNYTIMDVLLNRCSIDEAKQSVGINLDIVPGSEELVGADMNLTEVGKEYRLKEALEKITDSYDHVIIDTPPALGILTVNALTAADDIIIPTQADLYSLDAIGKLFGTISTVRRYTNQNLKISGILITRYAGHTLISKKLHGMISDVADKIGSRVFDTVIKETVSIKEAQAVRKDIYMYDGNSIGAKCYNDFVEEYLRYVKGE